jgi:hypothetical protein
MVNQDSTAIKAPEKKSGKDNEGKKDDPELLSAEEIPKEMGAIANS